MWTTSMSMIIMLIISMLLMTLCMIISKKTILKREKMSPFECGFDPKSSSRVPFSSQFFLIAVLFLVFDIEIMIIIPMIFTMKMTIMWKWFITTMMFIMVLLIGLYHEWKNGVLEWST